MNEKQWKKFLQQEMDKEMEEIDGILEEMDQNPETKDIVAPEAIHEKLLAQIQAGKEQEERLSDEEKELIRLGKVYKKRRKWNKVLVAIAAVVCAMAIGVTAFGGPTKIIQKVQVMLEGNEQINVDTEDGRTEEVSTISEVEAFEQIEDEFGIYPVELLYLPKNVQFARVEFNTSTQQIQLFYEGADNVTIIYTLYPNYRTGSVGMDVEDKLLDEYSKDVNGNEVSVKEYLIEENQTNRWVVTYEYQNVYYFMQMFKVEEEEVEKIIENLYFR